MDSKALQRDFTEDPNGIHKDSKAFQKGIHYSTHCKGIHRNLKAFQRALCILREFAWTRARGTRNVRAMSDKMAVSRRRECHFI